MKRFKISCIKTSGRKKVVQYGEGEGEVKRFKLEPTSDLVPIY